MQEILAMRMLWCEKYSESNIFAVDMKMVLVSYVYMSDVFNADVICSLIPG